MQPDYENCGCWNVARDGHQADCKDENAELLRRLDAWQEGDNAGPLIRWAAAQLRGASNA